MATAGDRTCPPATPAGTGSGGGVQFQFPITGLVPVTESVFFSSTGPRLLQAIPAMSSLGLSPCWQDCSFPVGRPLLPVGLVPGRRGVWGVMEWEPSGWAAGGLGEEVGQPLRLGCECSQPSAQTGVCQPLRAKPGKE